jgi:hypothetical protein
MRACPFCAEEIQDAAVVCKHCKRDVPSAAHTTASPAPSVSRSASSKPQSAPSGTTRRNTLLGLLVVLLLLVVLVVANSGSDNSGSGAAALASAVSAPNVIPIATNQELVIPAGSVQSFTWTAPQYQPNCHISGHIQVTDGGSKDVQVVVLDADDYQNWVNGHQSKAYFQTEKTTAVTLNVNTGTVGPLVVAISNGFSVLSDKKVSIQGLQATCR